MLWTKSHTCSTFHALISLICVWHFLGCWLIVDCCCNCSWDELLLLLLLPSPLVAFNWLFVVVTFGDVVCCWRSVNSVEVGDNFIRFAMGGVLDELKSSGVVVIGVSLLLELRKVVGSGAGGDRADSCWRACKLVRAGNGLKGRFGTWDVVGKLGKKEDPGAPGTGDVFGDFSCSFRSFCISASCAALAWKQRNQNSWILYPKKGLIVSMKLLILLISYLGDHRRESLFINLPVQQGLSYYSYLTLD